MRLLQGLLQVWVLITLVLASTIVALSYITDLDPKHAAPTFALLAVLFHLYSLFPFLPRKACAGLHFAALFSATVSGINWIQSTEAEWLPWLTIVLAGFAAPPIFYVFWSRVVKGGDQE